MHSMFSTRAAVLGLVVGLAIPPVASAQGRPGPDGPGSAGAWAGAPAWVPGVGASIRAGVRDASPEELKAAGMSEPGGAVVTQVDEGGPAATAGLKAGDLIVEFDGERVRSARHLVRLVRESAEGRAVKAVVSAQKQRRTVDVTPVDGVSAMVNAPEIRRQVERGARELQDQLRWHMEDGGPVFGAVLGNRRQLGVELMPLSEQLESYFGVTSGALVASVRSDSPAAAAGLKAGDVITSVNGATVSDAGDVAREIRRGAADVTLTVVRDRKELTLKATVPEPERRARPRVARPV